MTLHLSITDFRRLDLICRLDAAGVPTTHVVLTCEMRQRIETAIENLIEVLNACDGDPDIEACAGSCPEDDAGDCRELEEDFEPDDGWENPLAENHRRARLGPDGRMMFGNSEDDEFG